MKKLSFLALVLLAAIVSCTKLEYDSTAEVKSTSITRLMQKDENNIPFADSTMLSEFSSDKKMIDYRIARKVAIMELSRHRKSMNWDGYIISDKPVLVYGQDCKPKYYEFIMYDAEKKPKGTCITYARKSAPSVLNDLVEGVRNYSALASKGRGTNLQFFAGGGGALLTGVLSKGGNTPVGLTHTVTGEEVPAGKELTDEETVKMLSESNKQMYDSLKVVADTTSNTRIATTISNNLDKIEPAKQDSTLQADMKHHHEVRDKFWDMVSQKQDSLLKISDSNLAGANGKGIFDWVGDWVSSWFNGGKTTTTLMIDRYLQRSGDITARSGRNWCGPTAMNWIYFVKTGRADKYQYFENMAGRFPVGFVGTITFWLRTISFSNAIPMSPFEMFLSMLIASNWSVGIAPYYLLTTELAYSNIQLDKPVILCSMEGASLHWTVGYGCERTVHWWGYTEYGFFIWDNGIVTGDTPTRRHKRFYHFPCVYVPVLWD